MNVEEIPDGLHALQLAAKVCEDTLGLPATKGNLELVGACIEAVAKKMFKGRPDASKLGMFVLVRRIEEAQKQGEKITTHWLRNGEYWGVQRPVKEAKFRSCEKCDFGWVRVFVGKTAAGHVVDPKYGAVNPCECRSHA